LEDLDERNGMNSKEQNEETKKEKKATKVYKEKGHPSEEIVGERKSIEKFK
jgi:hypothetical protein